MPRGSYSTEVIETRPDQRAKLGIHEPRVFGSNRYGSSENAYIKPVDYTCVRLASDLADTWLELCDELGNPMKELFTAIREFVKHVDTQLHASGSLSNFGVSDLRRRHLDAWEADLLVAHRAAKSDTAYRKAIYLFALLRRIEEDSPGTLHPEVLERMESDTRLWHHRNEGVPPFADREVKLIRGRAHRLVHAHCESGATEPTPGVLVALHVMLSLATGEPPEVLRSLTTKDIVATALADADEPTHGLTNNARLTWLAEHDATEDYAVTYAKRRAREQYEDVYQRRNHAAHRTLTRVLRTTAALRAESGQDALWLVRRANGDITEPPWNTKAYMLAAFLQQGGVKVVGKPHWMRLRKVVVAREAGADPTRYLRMRRRHTPATFFEHYTNSEVLRAKAGRIFIDSVDEKFAAAVMGPTVITPEAADLIARGKQAPGLDNTTADVLLSGELDGPHTACRDPKDSPFAASGEICKLSMTGTCFGCGNALITEHHLPAALVIAEVADPDRAADREVWLNYWKPIWETITQVVLPAFPPEAIAAARTRLHLVPLDLGVRNDLRGTDED